MAAGFGRKLNAVTLFSRIGRMSRRWFWITFILLVAAFLRLYLLADVPPGMTHDEADHGLDAWGVVQGIRPIYFPTAYGREPFFDYATAILMSFLGPTFLAGRLVAVYFGLILIAATYAWANLAFNRRVAILTAAGIAVNFWAVMTARHALRSVVMPAMLAVGVALFWKGMRCRLQVASCRVWIIAAGIAVGVSFYTYLPARITWLLFPALLGYWAIFARGMLRAHWRKPLLVILLAGVIGAPLFYHLATTDAEARLGQLDGPIDAAREGDFSRLWDNIQSGAKILTVRGEDGPISLRYNLPGRPLLTPIVGILFYLGLLIALRDAIFSKNGDTGTSAAFALMWLIAGLAPSLITGADASTTRAIAMQPVLFLFPALALDWIFKMLLTLRDRAAQNADTPADRDARFTRNGSILTAILLFSWVGADTAQAYFVEWANLPDVRVQYETTRVTAIEWLNEHPAQVAAISSPRPDRFHDPSTALMFADDVARLRWFNGAGSLLLPDETASYLVLSGWAALHPALADFIDTSAVAEIEMREDDLDRPITIYDLPTQQLAQSIQTKFAAIEPVTFDDKMRLLGYQLLEDAAATPLPCVAEWQLDPARQTVLVLTLWETIAPVEGIKLFTHITNDATQAPAAGYDCLDVPSYYWHAGDKFVQVHQVQLPPDLRGEFEVRIGAYTQPEPNQFQRLIAERNGSEIGDTILLTTIDR